MKWVAPRVSREESIYLRRKLGISSIEDVGQ